jgi:hypothetical protein
MNCATFHVCILYSCLGASLGLDRPSRLGEVCLGQRRFEEAYLCLGSFKETCLSLGKFKGCYIFIISKYLISNF